MQWRILSEHVPKTVEELEQILLQNRDVADPEAFFQPVRPENISLEDVGIDLSQVAKVKTRILEAIEKKQKIIVFGDYDADGVSATAILWEVLHELGADALPFIPHREKHGYGLTPAALADVESHGLPDLLITVDTGIVAVEAVADLMKKGVDVILTDHHQPEVSLPPALAIVHTTQVCGSGVAWFLARELSESFALKSLDLLALATVSDLMPLKGPNRSFVFHGLAAIQSTRRLGLRVLMEIAGLTDKKISAGDIGYVLAPRINAMGRLSHGMDALRLLCTKNAQRAKELASIVDETNADRQQLTEDLLQLARQQAQTQKNEAVLIVSSPDFHEGVVGLVAGKLAEWYAKPVIAMSVRQEVVKGSARSVPGVNVTELLRTVREHLIDVGGHPMAAGFSMEPKNLEAFKADLFASARETVDVSLLVKTLTIDCALPPSLISENSMRTIDAFLPFGQENPEPVFVLRDMILEDVQQIGNQRQHLKLSLQSADKTLSLPALAWKKGELAENLEQGQKIHVVGVLQRNEWRNRHSLQFVLKDLQLEEPEF